tara:strand:- start:427 stop:894 length:468 start_codon:yes stop_codon:yes gene_type:complete
MTMAKRNSKYTRKKNNIDKNKVAEKLEKATKKVLSKNLFFSVEKKTGLFDIVEASSRQPVFKDIYLPETARRITKTLTRTPKRKIPPTVEIIHKALNTYQNDVAKHYSDLIFYRHTMKTTKDTTKFYSTESRAEISLMKLRNAKDSLHAHIHSSY